MSAALRQPSRVTCGAAVAVRSEMLVSSARLGHPAAGWDPDLFARTVLARHLQLTSRRTDEGRWQWPWPYWLGTPPWALAAHQ
ncbi:MAG: hypothetical protein ACI379_03095, partial [Nocardioides sp.]|uniref:hypothetical protein n=1 Tax=Nocardioides sp. TaxID=35761 RepID=UPI003F0DE113